MCWKAESATKNHQTALVSYKSNPWVSHSMLPKDNWQQINSEPTVNDHIFSLSNI